MLSYEYLEFVREVVKAAMKQIDRLEVHDESPFEVYLAAAYSELDKADELAKNLQKSAPYETED